MIPLYTQKRMCQPILTIKRIFVPLYKIEALALFLLTTRKEYTSVFQAVIRSITAALRILIPKLVDVSSVDSYNMGIGSNH